MAEKKAKRKKRKTGKSGIVRVRAKGKKYTDEQITKGLAAYVQTGSIMVAEEQTGLPNQRISEWLHAPEWADQLRDIYRAHARAIREGVSAIVLRFVEVQGLALTRVKEALDKGGLEPKEAGHLLGVLSQALSNVDRIEARNRLLGPLEDGAVGSVLEDRELEAALQEALGDREMLMTIEQTRRVVDLARRSTQTWMRLTTSPYASSTARERSSAARPRVRARRSAFRSS